MWHFRCKNCQIKEPEKCKSCEIRRFLMDCEAASDLIGWYWSAYHRADLGHREMIARLRAIMAAVQETSRIEETHRTALREIEQRVDSWLHQTI